jgi:ATP-dependent DNA helicase DinG
LIRDVDDFGVIVVGDPRIRTKAYGKIFLDSLPDSPVVGQASQAAQFLIEHLKHLQPVPAAVSQGI